MAKQSYGADAALVKGAGALGMSQIPTYDFSGITKNAEMWAGYLEKINTKKEAEREKQVALDYQAGKLLDEMPAYDPESTKLPENYEKQLTQWMLTQRDEAEILVNEIATLEGADKAEAEIKLGKIKKSMAAAMTNAASFDLESRQTLEDFNAGNYSETAVDMNKKNFQIRAAKGEEALTIDESGNFYFSQSVSKPVPEGTTDEDVQQSGVGTEVTKYNVAELFGTNAIPRKAGEEATLIMAQVMDAGEKGSKGKYDQFAQEDILIKIGNLTDKLTIDQALSLAGDKFSKQISGPLAGLSQEELRERAAKNPKAFREEVTRAYQALAVEMGQNHQDKYEQDLQEQKDKEAARLNRKSDGQVAAEKFKEDFNAGITEANKGNEYQINFGGYLYVKPKGQKSWKIYKAGWDAASGTYVTSRSAINEKTYNNADAAGLLSNQSQYFTVSNSVTLPVKN